MTRVRGSIVVLCSFAMLGSMTGQASADHFVGSKSVIGGFEVDGNFAFDGLGTTDWETAPNVVRIDDVGNSSSDSQFGGGSKEEEPNNWTYGTGNVPGKTDLTRVYGAAPVNVNAGFLKLAFERVDASGQGDAHVDFEINQSGDVIENGQGVLIPERTDGDLLAVYDYSGGTGPVNIQLYKWDGIPDLPNTPQNEEALFGVWVDAGLDPGEAAGDINGSSLTRPNLSPFDGGSVGARRFGEVVIDLGSIFGAGFIKCPGFTTFYAKSRSSGESFNSALKDITATAPIDISSCASVTVLKEDDQGEPLDGATFSLFRDDGDGELDDDDTLIDFCVTSDGSCTFDEVDPGTPAFTYHVIETEAPEGYVLDPTISTFQLTAQQDLTLSHTYVDPKIQFRMTLTPEDDSNLVDTDHVVTMLLEKSLDAGATWIAADGESVSFSLSGQGSITSITPAGEGDSCITDADGECEVTIHSDDPGGSTLTASFEKQTATSPVTAGGEATKTWANYRVRVTPAEDTNVVGDDHTFTVIVERTTDGSTWTGVAGATPTVEVTGVGQITSNTCAAPGTNAQGECTVTVTSQAAGDTNISATYLATEGDTSGEFGGSAVKHWADYTLTVEPDGERNPVRASEDDDTPITHVFTVTITRTLDGVNFSPVEGAMPEVSLTGVGTIIGNTCADPGTDADGECTVTITSSEPGTSTLEVTYLATEGSSQGTYAASAQKFWEDFRLSVTPEHAFNQVGEPHTFIVTLERDTGSGFEGWAGQTIDLVLDPGDTDATLPSSTCTTDANGQCFIEVNSTLPGTITLTATWSDTIGGISTSRSDSATKTYLAITVTKSSCPEVSPRGGIVDFSITFSVAGAPLTNATVVDVLDDGFDLVSAGPIDGEDPVITGQTITWSFASLAVGSYSTSIRVTVADDAEIGSTQVNTVTLDADEMEPVSDTESVTVIAGGEAEGRAYGVQVDLLGGGLLLGDPDIEAMPDSDVDNPDEFLAVPNPLGGEGPLVSLLRVSETDGSTEGLAAYDAVATAAVVDVNVPGVVRVQADAVVARSHSQADINSAGSSSAGSRVANLVINGEQYGDVTEPVSVEVNDPLTGELLAEVYVLEEIPDGAAAGEVVPGANGFDSGLVVNGIHVVVHDVDLTPIDESSDIIVSHAETSASYPSGIGCAAIPSVSGRAAIVDASANLGDDQLGRLVVGQVLLPITGGSDDAVLADVDLPIGTSDSGTTQTQGSLDPTQASSSATVEGLDLLGGMITATAVHAESATDLDGSTGDTTIADLVIGGVNVCETLGLESICEPAPNTVLLLPDVMVIVMLNEHLPEPGGLTVNAVHIWVLGEGNPLNLPAGADIIISTAHSDAHPAAEL